MSGATLASKDQITMPKDVRIRLGVDTGNRVEYIEMEPGVFKIIPTTNDITALIGMISKPQTSVSLQDMEAAIKNRAGNKR